MQNKFAVIVLIIAMVMAGTAAADVETGWPMDKPNEYNGIHVMIDFEDGMPNKALINITTDGIEFVAMDGHPWRYATKCPGMNIYPNGSGKYVVNGESGAWCGGSGNQGMITFEDEVGHVSLLVSTHSGVEIDAYNRSGSLVANSGRAEGNTGTLNFTRLSVDRDKTDIAYVIIHDSGNYWLIDDLIFGYEPVCAEVVINTDDNVTDIKIDDTVTFTVSCTDQCGEDYACTGIVWTSDNDNAGTLSGSVLTAVGEGMVNVTVTCDAEISGSIMVTVRENPYCDEVVINTTDLTDVYVGETADFTAICTNQYDEVMECPSFVFVSSNTTIGTFEETVLTALAEGTTNVRIIGCGDSNVIRVNVTIKPFLDHVIVCAEYAMTFGSNQTLTYTCYTDNYTEMRCYGGVWSCNEFGAINNSTGYFVAGDTEGVASVEVNVSGVINTTEIVINGIDCDGYAAHPVPGVEGNMTSGTVSVSWNFAGNGTVCVQALGDPIPEWDNDTKGAFVFVETHDGIGETVMLDLNGTGDTWVLCSDVPMYRDYEMYENEGITVGDDTEYLVYGYGSCQYAVFSEDLDYVCQLLVEFSEDDRKTLAVGEVWDLGGGFTLTAKQIDITGGRVRLSLCKDGNEIDVEIVSVGEAYTYMADVGEEDDVPVFSCYVSMIDYDTNLVQVKYVFLIDNEVLDIDDIVCIGMWMKYANGDTCEVELGIYQKFALVDTDPCEGVSCPLRTCVGYDLWSYICVDGECVKDELLEVNSVDCGYEAPSNGGSSRGSGGGGTYPPDPAPTPEVGNATDNETDQDDPSSSDTKPADAKPTVNLPGDDKTLDTTPDDKDNAPGGNDPTNAILLVLALSALGGIGYVIYQKSQR